MLQRSERPHLIRREAPGGGKDEGYAEHGAEDYAGGMRHDFSPLSPVDTPAARALSDNCVAARTGIEGGPLPPFPAVVPSKILGKCPTAEKKSGNKAPTPAFGHPSEEADKGR